MESVEFKLPDIHLPKLKKVIKAYFRANRAGKTVLSVQELVDYSQTKPPKEDWIYITQATGSNTFLCEIDVLERQPESKYRLTYFGLELGQSLIDDDTSKSTADWSKAIEHSQFLVDIFSYVRSIKEIYKDDLQNYIIAKVGAKPTSKSAQRGARTIIDIGLEAGYVRETEASNRRKKILVNTEKFIPRYISVDRIAILRTLRSKYNLSKLVKVCEEINFNYEKDNFFAVGILVRVILDHVPPLFGLEYKSFDQVVSNYKGKERSFHEGVENLNMLTRKISDGYLHHQISGKDESANPAQVEFQASVDVLLNEIINILSSENK